VMFADAEYIEAYLVSSVIASSNSLRCRAGSTARPPASTVAATKLSTPISMCWWFLFKLQRALGRDRRRRTGHQKHNDPQHRHDESQRQPARSINM